MFAWISSTRHSGGFALGPSNSTCLAIVGLLHNGISRPKQVAPRKVCQIKKAILRFEIRFQRAIFEHEKRNPVDS